MRTGALTALLRRSVLGLLATVLPWESAGQSTIVDRGTFEVSLAGRPAGVEDFVIRRAGVGPDAQTIATAEISLSGPAGRSELRPALQMVGSGMAVAAYQMKISGSRDEEVFVTVAPDRFILRLRSARGEQEGELRAAPNTLVLDADVAHHHYFLSQRLLAASLPLPVIVPGEGRRYEAMVVGSENEEIRLAGRTLQSRHISLLIGDSTREVWLDSEGRVLRVADAASGYVALRRSPP